MSKSIEGGESKSALGAITESLKSRLEKRNARGMIKSAERIRTNLHKASKPEVEFTDSRGSKFTAVVHPVHPAWGEDISAKIEMPGGRWSHRGVSIQLGWDYHTRRLTDLTVDCQAFVDEEPADSTRFSISEGKIDPESTMDSGVAYGYLKDLDSAIRQEAVAGYYSQGLFDVRFE